MAPDHQPADAVATTGRGIMRGNVVTNAHDVNGPSDTKTIASASIVPEPEITRRDVHTASTINAQDRNSRGSIKDINLAHQAALRRSSLKGKEVAQTTSKPVLVRALSKSEMKKKPPKPSINTESPGLPPSKSFSIQDILASVGHEADASIDAIAEICGRSKMSLAEEHGSHRPPHHFQITNTGISPAESLPSMRLEPVAESKGPQTRSKARSLALANASGEAIVSDATAATSNVTSRAQSSMATTRRRENSSSTMSGPLLAQIFAWLRGSSTSGEVPSSFEQDPSAARILQAMLSDNESLRS